MVVQKGRRAVVQFVEVDAEERVVEVAAEVARLIVTGRRGLGRRIRVRISCRRSRVASGLRRVGRQELRFYSRGRMVDVVGYVDVVGFMRLVPRTIAVVIQRRRGDSISC